MSQQSLPHSHVTPTGEAALARAKAYLGERWLLHEANKVQRRVPSRAETAPEHQRVGRVDGVAAAVDWLHRQGYPNLAADMRRELLG